MSNASSRRPSGVHLPARSIDPHHHVSKSPKRDGSEDTTNTDAVNGTGLTGDGDDAADSKDGDAKVKRKIACMACRNIKLRCLFANPEAAPLDPCKRCSRLNLDCIYKPKRRPIKPGQERAEQPVLGKNGQVSAAGVKLVEAGSVSHSRRSAKREEDEDESSSAPRKRKISREYSQSRDDLGSDEVSGSDSDMGDHQNSTLIKPGGRPGLPPPTFSWSDYDTSNTRTRTLGGGGSSQAAGYPSVPPPAVQDIDPILTNFPVNPVDPNLAGPSGYGSSGFGLNIGVPNNFPGSMGGSGLVTAGFQSSLRTDLEAITNDPQVVGAAGQLDSLVNDQLNNSGSGYIGSMPHSERPSDLLLKSGSSNTPATRGSASSTRSFSHYDTPSYTSPLFNMPGKSNFRGVSPSAGSKQRYPMALTTMLEVMSKDANGSIMTSGTPISAERDRRDGKLIERDFVPSDRYGAADHDRRASEDDRYEDSPHGFGPHGYQGGFPHEAGSGNDKDAQANFAAQGRSRRSMHGAGDDDDPRGYGESARPRKRMRWDDQVQLEASRKRSESNAYGTIEGSYSASGGGPDHRNSRTAEGESSEAGHDLGDPHEDQHQEGMEDPVTLGLISTVDVPFLFEQYHSRLNTYLALLDPDLHSPAYTLRTSPILFTAVLAVSAQVYLPEIYKPLRKRANDMLGIAFARGDAHIGMCQALSMLSVWKEANDKGSWLRVGYAIRVALELGLDIARKGPLPEDEFQAREILNGERTFRQLTAFDRTMFLLHGRGHRMVLPSAIHATTDWCSDHPDIYCYADVMLAASSSHGDLSELINTIRMNPDTMSSPTQGMTFKYILYNANREHEAWKELWLGPNPPARLHPISRAICGFYALNFEFEFEEYNRRFLPYHENLRTLGRTIAIAVQMLRYIITDLSPNEVILFAPDIITFRAAQAGVFLARHMTRMDPSTSEQVQLVFRDIARECKRFARGQNAAFYQAKFFASLLRISSVAPTRVATRENSPNPTGTEITPDAVAARLHQAGGQPPDFPVELDMMGFDDSLTIDALLEESHDWFSVDLLSHMNDPYWHPPPVITGYDQPPNMPPA